MVAAARRGARESLALGSSYQALQLAEMGLSEADGDLELRSLATRAAWLADLLEEAAEHGDEWLDMARRRSDIGQEVAALSLRLRIAYDLGELEAMDVHPDAPNGLVDTPEAEEERARAMATHAHPLGLRV